MNIGLTLIGQSITFVVFVWFCMKFIWPPLRDMMRERQEAIAAGLAAAEEADKKLAEAASGAEAELAKAKEEAAAIIEAAEHINPNSSRDRVASGSGAAKWIKTKMNSRKPPVLRTLTKLQSLTMRLRKEQLSCSPSGGM